jgi:uncharacterized protein YyaL (SSP411 family)
MANRQTSEAYTNRLIDETSPYLLQHAHNPVNWYPWGPEAFERARAEDKPIFLSVGYATCHWCHVMERESFEDEQTARLLNADFVAVKVDREQRPDVDDLYMRAVQMMTGSGGWPLSVFLTPQGEPFYGGTYFPPRAGFGRPSFRQVLQGIAQAWKDDRDRMLQSAQGLTETIRGSVTAGREGIPSPAVLDVAFMMLSRRFDAVRGGFGDAPKFPQPGTLTFLLHWWRRTGRQEALDMVDTALDGMMRGGIRDHLGGGFHRYATDARWLVPHFEKMLYDQALLSTVCVQMYQITGDPKYAAAARETFDYVLRDMTDAGGGFYSAEDADSEGREGAFYVWRKDEIEQVLGAREADLFCRRYGVTDAGNFENGENVLHAAAPIERLSEDFGASPAELEARLSEARQQLFEHRSSRPRPDRDDKIITAWNGLMISAMAYGGAVLDEQRYIQAARAAAEFVLGALRESGRLMRYFRDGRATEKGFLEDYAFLILGLIDLYEAAFEVKWLREARVLAEQMISLFGDETEGGFFLTGRDAEQLIAREKPAHDSAVPSGNSAATLGLLKLGTLFIDSQFTREAQRVLDRFSGELAEFPDSLTFMLLALDYRLGPAQQIVIAGGDSPAESQVLIDEVRRHFLPNAAIIFHEPGSEGRALMWELPFVGNLVPRDGHATAYVCEDYTCRRPVTTVEDLREILARMPERYNTVDSP